MVAETLITPVQVVTPEIWPCLPPYLGHADKLRCRANLGLLKLVILLPIQMIPSRLLLRGVVKCDLMGSAMRGLF